MEAAPEDCTETENYEDTAMLISGGSRGRGRGGPVNRGGRGNFRGGTGYQRTFSNIDGTTTGKPYDAVVCGNCGKKVTSQMSVGVR